MNRFFRRIRKFLRSSNNLILSLDNFRAVGTIEYGSKSQIQGKVEENMRKKLCKRSVAVVLMLMVLSTGLVANAQGSYTVETGDYLKKIAKSVYGDSARWVDIYEANKATVKNPNIIYKGQVLVLPDINPVPTVEEEDTTQAAEQEDTTQAETQEQTVTADTSMTLAQWIVSEEGNETTEEINEMMQEAGMTVAMTSDGNTLVFVYYFSPEMWGDLTAAEMAGFIEPSYLEDLLGELLPEMVEEASQEFATTYGITLEGINFVFVAPDGVPFYSMGA